MRESSDAGLGSGWRRNSLLTENSISRYEEIHGTQSGDPVKACLAMIKVVESSDPPLRLLLGPDAYEWAHEKIDAMTKDFADWKEVSVSTDFD